MLVCSMGFSWCGWVAVGSCSECVCDVQALEKYNIEKDIAAYIKKEFDKKYNPTWHCVVGRNFGELVNSFGGCVCKPVNSENRACSLCGCECWGFQVQFWDWDTRLELIGQQSDDPTNNQEFIGSCWLPCFARWFVDAVSECPTCT